MAEFWWDPASHARRRPYLLARNRMNAALRRLFEEQGFTEVETAALQVSPGLEPHLQAFATELRTPDGGRHRRYLHTSPEFACKKLLAAGEGRIFTFARVWRNDERSSRHHPEFTLLEAYQAYADYNDMMALTEKIISQAASDCNGSYELSLNGKTVSVKPP